MPPTRGPGGASSSASTDATTPGRGTPSGSSAETAPLTPGVPGGGPQSPSHAQSASYTSFGGGQGAAGQSSQGGTAVGLPPVGAASPVGSSSMVSSSVGSSGRTGESAGGSGSSGFGAGLGPYSGGGSGGSGGSGGGIDGTQPPRGGDPRPGGERRGVATPIVVLVSLVALLAGLVLGAVGGRAFFPESGGADGSDGNGPGDTTSDSSGTESSTSGGARNVDRPDASVASISDVALASTVYIESVSGSTGATGTGMIYSEDGLIVTNNHVIEAAADGGRISVTFSDGSVEEATIVGRSPGYDLAVLQVDRTDLVPLPLADSDETVVGDLVIAVGAPLGLTGTVTAGIISAVNRPVSVGDPGAESYINAVQTDAAINPGNSGGPLLNYDGEVVGINSVIYSNSSSADGTAGSIGLGFAIPSNQVERTVQQIIADGHASFAQIGITLDPSYFGQGVRVVQDGGVVDGGPGDLAGIEPGDIIRQVDGHTVTDPSEVIVFVRSLEGGDTTTLTIERDGQEMEVEVELTSVPEEI
jgi:putative serine protease PepD